MLPPKASLHQSKSKRNTAHDWLGCFDKGIAVFDLFTLMNLLINLFDKTKVSVLYYRLPERSLKITCHLRFKFDLLAVKGC